MATTFFLVRHATHDLVERILMGRRDGVPLGAAGRRQAQDLAVYFQALGITAIHSSPRERATETARPVAERAAIPLEQQPALDEIDVGDWSGHAFEDLDRDPAWQAWNCDRARARAPGGETMAEVQSRLLAHLHHTRLQHPDGRVVLVSHADVIKAALLHFLGVGLDAYAQIEIAPAGISTLVVGDGGGTILRLNERVGA